MNKINMGAPFGLLTTPVHYNHHVGINYVKEYASLPGTISSQPRTVGHANYPYQIPTRSTCAS